MTIITANTLELALRRTGLLLTPNTLDEVTKRQLEETAEILNARVTEFPPHNPDDDAILHWVARASRVAKLKMYYFLFLSGVTLTAIEENIKQEVRTAVASHGTPRLSLVKRCD